MGKYILKCPSCGCLIDNGSGMPSSCPVCQKSGLFFADYEKKQINLSSSEGISGFIDWLPVCSELPSKAAPVVFQNESLAKEIGVKNLRFVFDGYYPERNAFTVSGSFKEYDALLTFENFRDSFPSNQNLPKLVIASAGNAGRSFAELSGISEFSKLPGFQIIVVVPETAVPLVRVTNSGKNVKLIAVKGDFADAAAVAEKIAAQPGFIQKGRAADIESRAGAGLAFLEGSLAAGKIPDIFFRAAGSGAGCVAAFESAERLIKDGRFGRRSPEIHAVQNDPFVPLMHAWEASHTEILPEDMPDAENMIKMTYAQNLTDRVPEYGIPGGFYDCIRKCDGKVHSVTEKEAKIAMSLWQFYENCDLDPAAAVSLAGLISCIENGEINPEKEILLELTGGGYDRIKEDYSLNYLRPVASVRTDYDFENDPDGLQG